MEQAEKQKIIKQAIIIILLCIPMAFLSYAIIRLNNPTSYKTETVTATEPRVYVTTYGERYHSAGCSYLAKSSRAIGKQEAISKGYTACSRCGGRASGTIEVKYTRQVEVDGTAKNIWGAIGISVFCTPLLYGLIYAGINEIRESRRWKNAYSIRTSSTDSTSSPTTSTAISSHSVTQTPTATPIPRKSQRTLRIGDAVNHKTFGLGVVKQIDGKYFTVRFDHDSKDFIYPDVFESGIMENLNAQKRDNQ